MKIPAAKIAEPQVDNPRWRSADDDAAGKIGILADDGEFLPQRVSPKRAVSGIGADCDGGGDREMGRERQPCGQILIEQKTLPATETTE